MASDDLKTAIQLLKDIHPLGDIPLTTAKKIAIHLLQWQENERIFFIKEDIEHYVDIVAKILNLSTNDKKYFNHFLNNKIKPRTLSQKLKILNPSLESFIQYQSIDYRWDTFNQKFTRYPNAFLYRLLLALRKEKFDQVCFDSIGKVIQVFKDNDESEDTNIPTYIMNLEHNFMALFKITKNQLVTSTEESTELTDQKIAEEKEAKDNEDKNELSKFILQQRLNQYSINIAKSIMSEKHENLQPIMLHILDEIYNSLNEHEEKNNFLIALSDGNFTETINRLLETKDFSSISALWYQRQTIASSPQILPFLLFAKQYQHDIMSPNFFNAIEILKFKLKQHPNLQQNPLFTLYKTLTVGYNILHEELTRLNNNSDHPNILKAKIEAQQFYLAKLIALQTKIVMRLNSGNEHIDNNTFIKDIRQEHEHYYQQAKTFGITKHRNEVLDIVNTIASTVPNKLSIFAKVKVSAIDNKRYNQPNTSFQFFKTKSQKIQDCVHDMIDEKLALRL